MNMHTELSLSQTDHRPMYLQIMEQIRHRVAAGDWAPVQEIPSIRAMAAGLSISVITVKRAYLELEREGVIVTRQGKGSFISDKPGLGASLQQQALDSHLQDAIDSAALLGLDDKALLQRLQMLQQKHKEKNS